MIVAKRSAGMFCPHSECRCDPGSPCLGARSGSATIPHNPHVGEQGEIYVTSRHHAHRHNCSQIGAAIATAGSFSEERPLTRAASPVSCIPSQGIENGSGSCLKASSLGPLSKEPECLVTNIPQGPCYAGACRIRDCLSTLISDAPQGARDVEQKNVVDVRGTVMKDLPRNRVAEQSQGRCLSAIQSMPTIDRPRQVEFMSVAMHSPLSAMQILGQSKQFDATRPLRLTPSQDHAVRAV
ncbi:hypothetical protein C8Q73DRAFT_683584, partial [Cubamyces lactineus]